MSRASHLTADELAVFSAGLQRVAPVDESQLRALLEFGQVVELERGEHLLQAGEKASKTGLVVAGLLREYFLMHDGTERTKAFVQPSQSTGSLADLLSDQPSRAFIIAEEPTRVFLADFAKLRAVTERIPAWALWNLRLVEGMFVQKAQREYELLGLNAEQRYAAFEQRYPGLEARIAAKHIASYLGITPVHLSRLRRQRRKR